jgi:hypothetical protein
MKMTLLIAVMMIAGIFGAGEAAGQSKETVKVALAAQKTAQKKKLTVKFLSVVEDSRCPEDVDCVWAGNAKIKVKLTSKGKSKEVELNSNLETNSVNFEGYTVAFKDLTPYPKSTDTGAKKNYTAVFEVHKKSK